MLGNITLAIAAVAIGAAPHGAKLVVTVDGKPVEFRDAQPQTYRGRVMVPLRGVFEAIGAYVEYDPANHTIVAKKDAEDVALRLGRRIARKNGAEILMDVRPQVLSNTTMVPLRFLAEALGSKVAFDQANNVVNITTPTAPAAASKG